MNMNKTTTTVRLKTAMLTAALALLTAGTARADANPANDSGEFTVRITPNVDLGVIVDTSGANWAGASTNLDMTSDLATDTLLDDPIAVTMTGNFTNQELTLTGAALNTWQLDTDEVDAVDQVRLYAMFGSSAWSASPVEGDFAGAQNLIKTVATRAGQPEDDEGGDTNHVYELPIAHGEYTAGSTGEVDALGPTNSLSLWLRARTPNTTTTDAQAAFTVTVTAVSGAGL